MQNANTFLVFLFTFLDNGLPFLLIIYTKRVVKEGEIVNKRSQIHTKRSQIVENGGEIINKRSQIIENLSKRMNKMSQIVNNMSKRMD